MITDLERLYSLASLMLEQVDNPYRIQLQVDDGRAISAVSVMTDARDWINRVDRAREVHLAFGSKDTAALLLDAVMLFEGPTSTPSATGPDVPADMQALLRQAVEDNNRRMSLSIIARLRERGHVLDAFPTGVLRVASPWGGEPGAISPNADGTLVYTPGRGDESKSIDDLIHYALH